MQLDNDTLKDILLKENYVTAEDIAKAEEHSQKYNTSITDFLINKDIISNDLLGQAIAEYFKVSYTNVTKAKINNDIFFVIPEVVARSQRLVAVDRLSSGVKVVMTDPTNEEVIHLLEKRFAQPIKVSFGLEHEIEEVLKRYKSDIKAEYQTLVERLQVPDLTTQIRDEVVKEAVDLIMTAGERNKASDIHLEPYENDVVIRFRVDGLLHDILNIELDLYESMLARIKVLAKMRTDEHRSAQDGKFRFKNDEGDFIDVRVSVVPTKNSENIVMRLLSSSGRRFSLHDLGFNSDDLAKVNKAVKDPHGMILVTGPTGSGKTTTLYSILQTLNKREVNIATIEDPIEYDVDGITQIQVNLKTDLTFAKGLRAIVRQDPDIIMVGEVRDEETASISVNSALTGHLVLSTLHTNDAATALPRLLDMKIEHFLVTSTVNIIIGQRLVRKNCVACVSSYQPTTREKSIIKSNKTIQTYLTKIKKKNNDYSLYKGTGCKVCGQTGYRGRIGIFEIMLMTDEIRELIMKNANVDEIKKQAVKQGMTTMMEDGVVKMFNGVTTLDEVLRVTME